MNLSVLICTYNRHELLEKCLNALVRGTVEKPDEVIIVNGGSDLADQVVRNYSAESKFDIKLIKTENKNLASSRNVGIPHCKGEIIAFTDDDGEVFPDWVSRLKRAHVEHPEAGAVGGAVIGTQNTLLGRVADATTFPFWRTAQYVRTLPGVNISFKKAAIEQIGFQDESLFRGEDVDYNWRIIRQGYKIYYDPEIKVYHHHRATVRGLINQHYMYGRAYFLVREKWEDLYCIYPHRIRKAKDILKILNFIFRPFYDSLFKTSHFKGLKEKIISAGLFFVINLAWSAGVLTQAFKHKMNIKK